MKLFDSTLTTLERSLDARLLRQNVLAGNLANADTPSFTPKDVDFEKAMAEQAVPSAQPTTVPAHARHLPLEGAGPLAPTESGLVVQAEGATPGIDGNGVDLDRTMVALAQNALQYGASAKAAGKKLAILRFVASDGAA